MAYSLDYKKRAAAYKQEGHTFKQLREAFDIPSETYYDWKEKPEAFLKEYAEQFGCTPTAVFYALENLTITRKKRPIPSTKNQKRNGRSIERG